MISEVDEYPNIPNPPPGYLPSNVQYGKQSIIVEFLPSDPTSFIPTQNAADLTVVDPPLSTAYLTPPGGYALTMSASGPCTAMTYVDADDATVPYPQTDPQTGWPTSQLWDMGLNTAPPANPAGTPWVNNGDGCRAVTTMSDKPAGQNAGGAHGCSVNFLQFTGLVTLPGQSCVNQPTNWADADGSALGCPVYNDATASSQTGCVTLDSGAGLDHPTIVAVPSNTIDMPVACNFTYTFSFPHAVTYQTGGYHGLTNVLTGQRPGTNEGNAIAALQGEGDGLECRVQAQT